MTTCPTTLTARGPGLGSTVLLAIGAGLLAARPALVAASAHPAVSLLVLFAVLTVAGLALPVPPGTGRAVVRPAWAGAVGILGFVVARLLVVGTAPGPLTASTVAAGTLAAVAEEIWFRRLAFGLLAPGGPVLAVAGSAALFAAVHVPIYGFWVLPIDLAAGAVLGWQRHVTGSWETSAVTHAVANVLVLL